MKFDEILLPAELKEHLSRIIIEPVKRSGKPNEFSFILFGPPGTGKTSIPYSIAKELQWNIYDIGPHILARGNGSIERSVGEIFENIKEIIKSNYEASTAASAAHEKNAQTVILFDEIDELVVSRTSDQDRQTRFSTTMMLPLFNELRKLAKEMGFIFFVSTNHIERFDPAIKRTGRFDSILPIGPPDRFTRYLFFEKTMRDLREEFARYNIDLRYTPKRKGNTTLLGIDFNYVSRASARLGFGDISNICKKAVEQRVLMHGFSLEEFQSSTSAHEIRIGTNEILDWISTVRNSNSDIQKEIETFYQDYVVYSRGASPYLESRTIRERIHQEFSYLNLKNNLHIIEKNDWKINQTKSIISFLRNLSASNTFFGSFTVGITGAGISTNEKIEGYIVAGKSSELSIIEITPTKIGELKISYEIDGYFKIEGIASSLKKRQANVEGSVSFVKVIEIKNN